MRNKNTRKLTILCLALVLCACLLSGCGQEKETFPNQPRQETATTAPEQQGQQNTEASVPETVNFNDGSYDPASEEDGQVEFIADSATPAPTVRSEYAGATPVKIDPVDKPTPTPLPKLTFTYSKYQAQAMHLSFEGPAGWIAEEIGTDRFRLTNPDPSMDYAATVEIQAVPVTKDYSQKELTKEVKTYLDNLRSQGGFADFDSSNTATRAFIDGNGVYATYRGTLQGVAETGVAGRVIINCVKKTLYILHASYPRGLADTFADGVYNKVRHSMKLTD
ncbi:MAG: hypothetical protein IKQ45_07700 [Clostridia bacterium]|nr:hypothetical protein [Clostridia bacterium]